MDQIASTLLTNGPLGLVCLVLLYVTRQLWQDGKEKDKALLDEKDRRLADAIAAAGAVSTAIKTLSDQSERLETALSRK